MFRSAFYGHLLYHTKEVLVAFEIIMYDNFFTRYQTTMQMSPPDINTSIHIKYVHVNAFIDLLALVHVLMREILCEPQVNQHP